MDAKHLLINVAEKHQTIHLKLDSRFCPCILPVHWAPTTFPVIQARVPSVSLAYPFSVS